jgi:hypothetical protein
MMLNVTVELPPAQWPRLRHDEALMEAGGAERRPGKRE